MSEIVTSLLNKNSLLYGSTVPEKNVGPACVGRKGEDVCVQQSIPTEAPIKAIREK